MDKNLIKEKISLIKISMPILSVPLGIKLYDNSRNFPRGTRNFPRGTRNFPHGTMKFPHDPNLGGRSKNFTPGGSCEANSLKEIGEKLPPGWRPPKTSKRKSRPKSTRSKNIKNFPRGN